MLMNCSQTTENLPAPGHKPIEDNKPKIVSKQRKEPEARENPQKNRKLSWKIEDAKPTTRRESKI